MAVRVTGDCSAAAAAAADDDDDDYDADDAAADDDNDAAVAVAAAADDDAAAADDYAAATGDAVDDDDDAAASATVTDQPQSMRRSTRPLPATPPRYCSCTRPSWLQVYTTQTLRFTSASYPRRRCRRRDAEGPTSRGRPGMRMPDFTAGYV